MNIYILDKMFIVIRGGGGGLLTCLNPLKVQACPPQDPRLAIPRSQDKVHSGEILVKMVLHELQPLDKLFKQVFISPKHISYK